MLVDDAGKTGTADVQAPDLLIVQQVRGTGQATAYADQLSAKFGLPAGTYRAILAWDDPEPWGGSHRCSDQSLGDLKKKQTNDRGTVHAQGQRHERVRGDDAPAGGEPPERLRRRR
ncbi:hypothetical protein [Asanoa siamensis]|uniref:Uncharacterized protein n=1 Tax=Asanoa siamensis TaxID=926357 RepID=A0ABQ4CUQ4_9ACTN|nr:hypothetical protein [Asanoa siamensis]GIF75011.1 hypothetical protein Asi02nite_45290 [Asanoa siamensis]